MDLEEAKVRLGEEGYCILEDRLDPREAERFDRVARSLMEPEVDSIRWREGYLNMEDSLTHSPISCHSASTQPSWNSLKR